jgi:hypothetical protein
LVVVLTAFLFEYAQCERLPKRASSLISPAMKGKIVSSRRS